MKPISIGQLVVNSKNRHFIIAKQKRKTSIRILVTRCFHAGQAYTIILNELNTNLESTAEILRKFSEGHRIERHSYMMSLPQI